MMKKLSPAFLLILILALPSLAAPPDRDTVLKEMAIPSSDTVRGQKDGVGYARTAEQMTEAWELSATAPSPLCFDKEILGEAIAVIVPHDDYVYAGRIYRALVPSLKAKTVVIIAPFHRWKDFGVRGKIVFDGYKAWRTPDGEVPVSKIRDIIVRGLPASDYVVSNTMHDAEHSIEGPLYWLKRANPSVEIIPILVTPMDYPSMEQTLYNLKDVLGNYFEFNGLKIGKDVAFLISADGVHYGEDFNYIPYGAGGVDVYLRAVEEDKRIISKTLSGTVNDRRIKAIFSRFQDPNAPEAASITWCGRFSIPFGLSLASDLFSGLKAKGESRGLVCFGTPIAYSTSVGAPSLPSKTGLSSTAPSNLYHFVGYPGVFYGKALIEPLSQNREPLE